jgi:hypothetical protein
MYQLAVTAIFQNEARFLKEWIDFHLLMGARFFYLFDHFSEDAPEKVLKPYISDGSVKLVSWPILYSNVYEWTELQCLAYERALHWAANKTKWLALLDVDEFLFSPSGDLLGILDEYEAFGGVAVNWQVFGTSNVARIPKGKKMTDLLYLKAIEDQSTNLHVKSIVRPERVKGCDNAHSMTYLPGYFQVNTKKECVEGALSKSVLIDQMRINHYTLRDERYLKEQKLPRLKKWWGQTDEEWAEKHTQLNQVVDLTIQSLILKKKP